ncbi:MAG: hypothetical protein J0I06_17895 [Planctomycetes bacterium]|nr:hypothetical protein [Planctomycetota bacterium]
MVAVPSVRVGAPLTHDKLTVFPLYLEVPAAPNYRFADEALADGSAVVEEVSEGGSVPNLAVDNKGEALVLFVEGQELRGAKQNRVLNTSVLIAAKTKTVLPVSCVEQGRWRYTSKQFTSSEYCSSSKLRQVLKKSVNDSTLAGGGHTSDQGAVWTEVSRQMRSVGSTSETMALADTMTFHKSHTDRHVAEVAYSEGAAGLAIAVGGRLVSVDLFDAPETCRKVWPRVIRGVAMDAMEERSAATVSVDEVTAAVASLRTEPWKPVAAAGAGEEQRSESPRWHGSALSLNGNLVHGSLVTAAV